MPTEGHSFMFGGTKKRSTLVDEKLLFFPREDASSPRTLILTEFCPNQYRDFKKCLEENGGDENKCPTQKKKLTKCSNKAFKAVNSDLKYSF